MFLRCLIFSVSILLTDLHASIPTGFNKLDKGSKQYEDVKRALLQSLKDNSLECMFTKASVKSIVELEEIARNESTIEERLKLVGFTTEIFVSESDKEIILQQEGMYIFELKYTLGENLIEVNRVEYSFYQKRFEEKNTGTMIEPKYEIAEAPRDIHWSGKCMKNDR
jgi:hypothetical protein